MAPEARQIMETTWFSASCVEGRCCGGPTLRQALKTVEAAASNSAHATPLSVLTLVEEVAAGARRVVQTRILPAAVGTVEVGAQSAWVAVQAVGVRQTQQGDQRIGDPACGREVPATLTQSCEQSARRRSGGVQGQQGLRSAAICLVCPAAWTVAASQRTCRCSVLQRMLPAHR